MKEKRNTDEVLDQIDYIMKVYNQYLSDFEPTYEDGSEMITLVDLLDWLSVAGLKLVPMTPADDNVTGRAYANVINVAMGSTGLETLN